MQNSLEYVPGDNLIKEFIPVDPAEHSQWTNTWSDSSYSIDNFFTEDELLWLEELMYKQHISRRVKKNGTLHFNVDNRLIQNKFYDKLKTLIPEIQNETIWEGNFLITATPYNLHIDTGNPNTLKNSNSVPGKQFIIPLWVCHTNKEDQHPMCGTAIFKNRFLMYGTNFAKNSPQYETNVFYTISNYRNMPCYNSDGTLWDVDWDKHTIDDETYMKYFSHYKREWLDGFELEAVYNWCRGNIIVFDRCQAHSGINFQKNGVTMKAGLSMMTTIKK